MNIWFSSDFHYSHKNICRGTSEWDKVIPGGSHQSTRDFKTVEEMNAAIVNGINKNIAQNDTLYFLGDWSFGGIDNIWELRRQIKCDIIHFIFGNHDHHIENNKVLKIDKGRILSARNLFESTGYVKQLSIDKHRFFLSHFAHRVWDKSHHGMIHLYGHSHASLDKQGDWGKSIDVGIDNHYRLYGTYEPFSLEKILKIMEKRDALIVDHHNKNTN